MLRGAMGVWFVLTGASVAFVVWDSLYNGVTSWVQRIAWILVTIYAGPVALVLYLLACRRPFPGGHDAFTRPTWKQALNSEMHCLAGDATGIAIAAGIVSTLGLTNGWDALVEYTGGFVVGLFIFQALMMRNMYDGDYRLAVRKTLFVETLSMNFVMTGMIPVMVLLAAQWPASTSPLSPEFWFRMSIAAIVGGVIAYPVNYWLVASHLKHGCMTLPDADGPAPDLGHVARVADGTPTAAVAVAPPVSGGDGMQMASLPFPRMVLLVAGSYALLFAALWLTNGLVPIQF